MLVNEVKLDPRVKRTRKLLQDALTDLLREKEFHSITVQDIAERAEVNRATFYAHFEDKFALLNYSVRSEFQALLDRKLPAAPTLTRENLRLLTLSVCDYMGYFIGHCAPTHQSSDQMMMVAQVHDHLYGILLEWVKKLPQTPAKPDIIAMVVSWAIFGSVLQWGHAGRKISAEQLTDQVLATLQDGLQGYLP